MDKRYLEAIIYLCLVTLLLFALKRKLRERFWFRYGTVMFPLIVASLLLFNLISFPTFNNANKWNSNRLPSNGFFELMTNSLGSPRISWVYFLIDDYYYGRTLYIPEEHIDNLGISLNYLQNQSQFADVKFVEFNTNLSEKDLNVILNIDYDELHTMEGLVFILIKEEESPSSPIMLLKHENMYIFLPEDILPGE